MAHPAIQAYNDARDREQHAFEVSPLGDVTRRLRNHQAITGRFEVVSRAVLASLAAEVAFKRSMPAFYAGRELRLWGFNGEAL